MTEDLSLWKSDIDTDWSKSKSAKGTVSASAAASVTNPCYADVTNTLEGMEDDISEAFLPLPVCTSTPYVGRPRPKFLDSVVSILKLDDSGLGDTLRSSPSSSETASPSTIDTHSYTSYRCSPVVSEGLGAAPIPFTPSDSPGDQTSRFPDTGGISASTPITQSQSFSSVVKQFVLAEEASSLSQSPLSSPSFLQHRKSPELIYTEDSPLTDTGRLLGARHLWPHEEETEDEAYKSQSGLAEVSTESVTCHGTDLALHMNRVLREFSPPVPGHLVGRSVGVEHVDIIGELYDRNLPARGVVAWVMPYLRPMDFIRMSGVCRRWRRICLQDDVIHRFWRLCTRLHSRPDNKENKRHSKETGGSQSQGLTRSLACLGGIQHAVPQAVKHSPPPLDLYEKVRKSLRWEEIMRHCPLCHNMAKVVTAEERAVCQNTSCGNNFCTRCLSNYHPSSPCLASSSRSKKETPGNKKSKKLLKRIISL